MKFHINKKKVAKEIILFWFIILPILIVFIYTVISNSIFNNRINAEKEMIDLEERKIEDYYKIKNELSEIVDISINSFEDKIDSLRNLNDKRICFETNYPELQFFTKHLDDRMFNLIFQLGIPEAKKDSILEIRNFWDNYLDNLGTIYKRDKKLLDKKNNVQEKDVFENILKNKITNKFEFRLDIPIQRIEHSKSKLQEYQSRLISVKQRNKIILYAIIGYLLLIYPIRFIITIIVWSIKTLKK